MTDATESLLWHKTTLADALMDEQELVPTPSTLPSTYDLGFVATRWPRSNFAR